MPFLDKHPSKGTKGHKLTPKMVEFIDQYLVYQNGPEAVRHTSYKTKNPHRMASELLAHPLVREEIQRRLDKRSQSAEVKAEYLIGKLLDFIEDDEIKPADKLRAIELAGKSIALWKERQEISGPNGEAIKHEQAIKENVDNFTNKLKHLSERSDSNVVPLTVVK